MKVGVLIGGLFLALLVASVVIVDLQRTPSQYTVKGQATIKYMPDTAGVEASVLHSADASVDAARSVADDMGKVIQALKAAGVTDADLASRTLEMHTLLPDPDTDFRHNRVSHLYVAKQTIVVTVHDLSKVAKITGILADNGSNQWHAFYYAADRGKLEEQATQAAFADAIKKADTYAAAGGFKRGRVLKMSTTPGDFPSDSFGQFDTSSGGLEEIVVTARKREGATEFTVPKPEEQSIDGFVGLALAIR